MISIEILNFKREAIFLVFAMYRLYYSIKYLVHAIQYTYINRTNYSKLIKHRN